MKKIFLLAVTAVMMSFGANAQKFAYVNSQEILMGMPEMTKANKDLETYANTFHDAYKTMATEYQTKLEAYQKNAKTMSDAVKEVKEKELTDLGKRIEDYDQSSQQKIEQKRNELMKPIFEKAQAAIKAFGAEKGYDYIFEAGSIVYAKDSDNVTNQIKTKLGAK